MTFDLFPETADPHANILPYDGIVNDYGIIFTPEEADVCLHTLLRDIPWRHDQVRLYGKTITTPPDKSPGTAKQARPTPIPASPASPCRGHRFCGN